MRNISRKAIAILMMCAIMLSLAACNTSASVSKKATQEDVDRFVDKVMELNQLHAEIDVNYSNDAITDSAKMSLNEVFGLDEAIFDEGNILSVDIDKDNKLSSGTIKMQGYEMPFLDTEDTTYIGIDMIYQALVDDSFGITKEMLEPYFSGYKYFDMGYDIDILEVTDLQFISDTIHDNYSNLDMKLEATNSNKSGKEVLISVVGDHLAYSKTTGEEIVDYTVWVNLTDIDDGGKYIVEITVSSDEGDLSVVYTYQPVKVSISIPSEDELLTEEIINEIEASFNGSFDDNDIKDDPNDWYLHEDNNTSTPSITSSSETLSDGTILKLREDALYESYAEYDTVFTVKESEISSKYSALGEFDYTSDFRRKFGNTYNSVISTLKSTLGFEESEYGLNAQTDSSITVQLSNKELEQSFGISSYIWGSTNIRFSQEVDEDGVPTLKKLEDVADNLNMYTGLNISGEILQELVSICENYRLTYDPESFYYVTFYDEDTGIKLEITRYTFMTEFEVVRSYDSV